MIARAETARSEGVVELLAGPTTREEVLIDAVREHLDRDLQLTS